MARSKLHVLVVDDDAAGTRRVRDAIETRGAASFRATYVRDLGEAAPRLHDADLVLLDVAPAGTRATEAVDRVRASAPRLPVVVLSGSRDDETAFRCLQHGAQDVLVRDSTDADTLLRSLRCAVERQALAAERDAAVLRTRKGEDSLRVVLSASAEGFVVCEPGGRTLFSNPSAEALLGWAQGSGAGRPVNLPLDASEPQELERRGTGGEIRTLELQTQRISWEGAPAVLATLHDLTGRRRAEEERRELEARRREAESLGALGRLSGGIAHGLNNQLTVVLGFASLLLEEGDRAGSVAEHARCIQEAGWCAADLVKQLTACAGRQPALPEALDLNEVVTSLRERVETMADGGITVRWDLRPEALPLRADRRLIEQALLAMVEHARDSMPGGGELTVGTGVHPHPGRGAPARAPENVILSVSDTGPGLGAEARRRLFEPFYTTEVLGIGSGLGLAPVHGIAQQCGGKAEVSGGWSRGTTLRLVLPTTDEDALPITTLEREAAAEAAEQGLPRGTETVLVVEEDASCREMILSSLKDLGYRVLAAADAGDAVRAAMAWDGPIPLLVAGYRAPGLRGPVLARVLRCRKPELRSLYLVSESEGAEGGSEMNFGDRTLAKPFAVRDLASEVRRTLDQGAPAAASTTDGREAVVPQ